MDPAARKRLNLAVLRRHDPAINDILDQSAHAVFYKFAPEKQSWDKMGFEGVVFLTRRRTTPYFGLYMLNRLAIENYSLLLTDFEEIKMADEFIIYQTKEGEACGLWLFEAKDRDRILKKIIKLNESMKTLPSAQAKQVEQSKVDIMHMLQRATLSHPPPQVFPTTESMMNTEVPTHVPSSTVAATGEDDVKGKLLQLLTRERSAPEPEPASVPLPMVEPKKDILQILSRGKPMPRTESEPAAPFMNDVKGDLLHILTQGKSSPLKGPGALPLAAQAPLADDRELDPAKRLFDMLKCGPANPVVHQQPISSSPVPSSSTTKSPQPGIQFPAEQLTKPFHPLPSHMHHSPSASPNNAAALLQTLHGGAPSMRGYISVPPPPPMHLAPSSSTPSLGHAPPLLPQQTIGLTQPEIERRFGRQPLLSKPEFIQQYLNIVQNDPLFLDTLYENYRILGLSQGDHFPNGIQ